MYLSKLFWRNSIWHDKTLKAISRASLRNLLPCYNTRGTFVSWWYLPRIWPSVTDMQYYYHARYPTDDWHLAYMFSLVYFSVEVCLEGVFPHSVITRWDSRVRVYAPLTLASPLTKKKIEQGGHISPLEPSGGGGGHLNWRMDLPALLDGNLGCRIVLSSTYIAQFMRCVIGRIHYGLKVVFCFIHFTAFHYHHYTRLLTGTEYI